MKKKCKGHIVKDPNSRVSNTVCQEILIIIQMIGTFFNSALYPL